MSGTLKVRVLRNKTELDGLRDEWESLLSASRADCLFLTWEWLTTWLRHLSSEESLHTLEVRDGDRLVGLAPLRVTRGRLEFLGTGTVGSDYLDIISHRDRESEVVEAMARSLEETDLNIRLSHILPDSLSYRLAERLKARGYRVFDRVINVCPFAELAGNSWDQFLSTLGKRHRENVRRRIRKLPADASFERTTTEAELRKNLPVLIDLHNQRWDTRGGSDALQEGSVKEFHQSFTALALQREWLRLYLLSIGGKPAAAVYAFHRNGRALYYQAGVAPEYGDMSLGLVALALWVKSAIEEGATEFDLLHGNEEYKSLWTQKQRELRMLEAYPQSLKGRLMMHSHRVIRAAKTMARYVIAR
jgi:CelD/BcsL family acetyltransferase involved in cellulose biosynthesis